jgi:excisionase family DNA binding protein
MTSAKLITPIQAKRIQPSRFLSVADVALLLDVSQKTVRIWIKKQQLPHHRLGGLIRIAEDDLRAFLAMRRQVL